jgi:hypothetical protein
MRPFGLALGLMLVASLAHGETQTLEQRVASQLGSLMLQNATLASRVDELNDALTKAQQTAAEAKAQTCSKPGAVE